ncbi:hypothetical protein AA103196_2210 [Ameyamaea chiangmaiensis NBRC 103196]|uniref:YceI family protein n=1 Tax=Ameyamaea chiangmaiensis TaxID=442969 RepID=A0A850PGH9_9PROT|nr:YceI family protein [Ameyamaea chiangmaiensis]MBS4075530.1 YceI family protein [Ameyamaea chiangmaiensis]NVN41749.1 YceI family protein [Ameyamaea chiangmaiensis]GBQ69417.1 hypothetical protein AA103196_2210 [Ameyamaea chiangmaiensis NBRC 103196]
MNTTTLTGLLALSLAVATPAAHAATAPHDVPAGHYAVETNHTQVTFSVLHFGFTAYSGMFSGATGTLDLDPAHLAGTKLEVSIPVSSVQTTSDRLTGELKEAEWFDATKYPTATFVSTKVTPEGANKASIAGLLTLHGVSKPVVLHATFVGAGTNPMDKAYTVGFQGTTTVRRSEFGVKTYVPMVGDDVTLSIAAAFEKQN